MAKKRTPKTKASGEPDASKSETSKGTKKRSSSVNRRQSGIKKMPKPSATVEESESRLDATTQLRNDAVGDDGATATQSVQTPSYQLDEDDLLDPGAQIVRACSEAARRHLEDGAELARRYALLRLLEQLIGPKRRFQPARAQIHWRGPEGQQVPAGVEMTSEDGRFATSDNEAFTLGGVAAVFGIGESGVVEFPLWSEESPEDQQVDDSRKISKLRVRFSLGSTPPEGEVQFPGLLWNLTPSISCRIQSVTSPNGVEMEWRLDHAGRLVVPIQRASLFPNTTDSTHPTHCVDIQCRVEPGEARHLPPPLLNVSEIEETIGKSVFLEIAPSTFETPVNRLPGVSLEQPFAGAIAVPEEDDELWMRRASKAVRHGSRAVTPQDYTDLAADHVPAAKLVEVAPTRVPIDRGFSDAVRLTLAPTHWESLTEFLSRALVCARDLEFALNDKTPLGVKVVAGPPSIVVPETPGCNDPLWLFREFLVASSKASQRLVCRHDGVYWPLLSLANLRGER